MGGRAIDDVMWKPPHLPFLFFFLITPGFALRLLLLWACSLIGLFNKQSKDNVRAFSPPHAGEKPVMLIMQEEGVIGRHCRYASKEQIIEY